MATQLTPSPALPERFANPVRQINDLLALPVVRRSLPMVLLIALIASAAGAWLMLATPPQKVLFQSLPDSDKAAVTSALQAGNIASKIDSGTGALTVAEDDYSRARLLLASQGLPKAAPGGYALLDQLPMGVSRAVEGERLRQARETELAKSIEEIDAVAEARVHLAMPETSVFVRDNSAPSASVIVKLQPGRSLSDAQVASIVNLTASSVPGMKPDMVTIVDQMGALLTHAPGQDGGSIAAQARIDFQRRIEDKYRQQLAQMLTPLVGVGNFSAEIQAEVNLDETQATRETYDKSGALRAEQGNWSGETRDGANGTPGGIPGALSNTPPPPAAVTAPKPTPSPTPTPAASGTPAAAATASPAPAAQPAVPKAAENYARAYDLDKEVSVTRAIPGQIKRLSVAVLLRDNEKGKPRSPAEIQQITQLVRAAVGYDAARNDQVIVVARKFAGPTPLDEKQPWYEAGWVAVAARNGTAIIVALLLVLFGVRPIVKSMTRKRPDDGPRLALANSGSSEAQVAVPNEVPGEPPIALNAAGQQVPVSIDMLDQARSYDERIGMVRGFTRDNPTRAALAVRDMIKADAR
ncbi:MULTISPECIES: flagellar basal-body MS-ring/collar protein FliF [Sphingomonas]|uniref:flagellar basal-body MS-ring/collar protein FliF n=1 Tax=Sphingomonas TaxID=13687 RepID=UPI00082C202A|nr:flagellar basal-body MS-ring/collar protein FliF [Sphingomonas sp. CCH10-B3]MBA3879386.1 flagellar M-ring protein FliF [Sphingobium sp.]